MLRSFYEKHTPDVFTPQPLQWPDSTIRITSKVLVRTLSGQLQRSAQWPRLQALSAFHFTSDPPSVCSQHLESLLHSSCHSDSVAFVGMII